MLRKSASVFAGGVLVPRVLPAFCSEAPTSGGAVIGEPTAEKIGNRILADGGNAFDAIVTAALCAAMAAPHQTGIGGYGGSATLAPGNGDRVVSVDFNSTAPSRATPDMFQPGADGKPRNDPKHGWLATGVPGILAGLHFILAQYGTLRFSDVVEPAIQMARHGIELNRPVASIIESAQAQFARDPGSRALYLPGGNPIRAGERLKNPQLAEMLATLAKRESVESFYRGDIAQHIAEQFALRGGLVNAQDLAAYKAREVQPITWQHGDTSVHMAPLTAGGLTVIQAFCILDALAFHNIPTGIKQTHARVEALRMAWRDRLTLLGDPNVISDPTQRLLSNEYAKGCAAEIRAALADGKFLDHRTKPREDGGTISLSAADRRGNFVALTLTHGDSFGARVTVDGLGLTLGHGMSRFDTDPAHPNAPAPGKRPLHNMCPAIVARKDKPILAVGGRGGRKIPNALFEVLSQFVLFGRSLAESVAAPRLHTEGNASLVLEQRWSADEQTAFRQLGYQVTHSGSATVSAVAFEDGELRAAMR